MKKDHSPVFFPSMFIRNERSASSSFECTLTGGRVDNIKNLTERAVKYRDTGTNNNDRSIEKVKTGNKEYTR